VKDRVSNPRWPIHKARQKQIGSLDALRKDRIRNIFLKHFELNALEDEVIFFDKETGKLSDVIQSNYLYKEEIYHIYHVHFPDLIIRTKKLTVIEIDGDVHWLNSKAIKSTNERNLHYEDQVNFIWLTNSQVDSLEEEALVGIIKTKL
jgi:hypothetical protein